MNDIRKLIDGLDAFLGEDVLVVVAPDVLDDLNLSNANIFEGIAYIQANWLDMANDHHIPWWKINMVEQFLRFLAQTTTENQRFEWDTNDE